jgi:hypothetical protein
MGEMDALMGTEAGAFREAVVSGGAVVLSSFLDGRGRVTIISLIFLKFLIPLPWSGTSKWKRSFCFSTVAKVPVLFDDFDGLFVVVFDQKSENL